ncbi:MAG: histidine phosphatase family protein [Aquificaceae bacterium]
MKKYIYLLRHAQSEFNERGIFQGRLDSDLTPLGYVQSRLSAQELIKESIQIIYSSPQRRAYKTALTIGDMLGLDVTVDDRLREMSFGDYEGTQFWIMVQEHKEIFLNWLSNPVRYPLPTQESMEEFEKRVKSFTDDLIEDQHERVLVVAHGGTLHAIVCLALGLGLENLWNIHMDNTAMTRLVCNNGRYHIDYLNRLCHSDELL